MTVEFQKEVLQFFAQRRSARTYYKMVDPDIFSDGFDHLAFSVMKSFFEKYESIPTMAECLEFFVKQSKESSKEIAKDVYNSLEKAIRLAYTVPYAGSEELIKDTLIEQYQVKLLKDLVMKKSIGLSSADMSEIRDFYREVRRIEKISEKGDEEKENNQGTFLIKDREVGTYDIEVEAHPTDIVALNKMTAKGGFASPELIILMSGPKKFKTGLALRIARGYVRDGKKVYYADTENGQKDIKHRFQQSMLRCTLKEYKSGELNDVLEEMLTRYGALGGDFLADYYPAQAKDLGDVEERLNELRDEQGWVPDVIIYDNLDNFNSRNKALKEKRFQITSVYFDAIRLQKARNMVGFTLSQVTRSAVNKRVIEVTDFAEDFGKAANCHAAFAFCADEFEMKAKVRRLVSVVQRQGSDSFDSEAAYFRIDAKRQILDEITHEEWKTAVLEQELLSPAGNKQGNQRKSRPNLSGLVDK